MNQKDLYNSIDTFKKLASSIFNSEKLLVPILANKAKKLAEHYPQDITCVAMCNFLQKRANASHPLTRGEFRDVYSKLYSNNNKFADHFKEELAFEEVQKKNVMMRDPNEGSLMADPKNMAVGFNTPAYSAIYDQLDAAFANKAPTGFSKEAGELAVKACARELNSISYLPKRIEAASGNADIILCRADYNTPKGQSSVIIPVEVKSGRVLSPSLFLDTTGFNKLNENNISEFLNKTAGKKFSVDTQGLINKLASASIKEDGEVESILKRVLASKATPLAHTGIIIKEIDPVDTHVKIAQIRDPEADSIGEMLSSPVGEAEFKLGKDLVNKARNLVKFEIEKAGFKNPQISVVNSTDNSVSYAVSVGSLGCKATVKIAKGQVVAPKVVLANGMIYELSAEGLQKVLSSGNTDSDLAAKASALGNMKASELVNVVRAAILDNKFDLAGEALHVLKHANDQVAYSTAYNTYVAGLKGELKESVSKCLSPVKLASSQHTICSHTGLPLNKVYQDKHGNCQPLYRKGMEETSTEGVSTIVSKVYFD